jgi:hypothetical protein
MVANAQKTIKPNRGESYREFVYRAHQALMPAIPSWEARNKAVWDAWDHSNGNPIRETAQQYFAKDCSRFVPDVCYFMEHETIGSDGQPVKYSFNELADICEEQNSRCDTHNYSAISDRHNRRMPMVVPQGMKVPESQEPQIVGYAGAARLGMVGNQQPKWAVFMDEHHLASGVDVLNQKRRRSVEINRFKDSRRPYFDPIAALGADSPRLPLPVAQYSSDGDQNHLVDYYESPVMVGSGNAYIPAMGDPKKRVDQYGDQPQMQPHQQPQTEPEGSPMQISQEDVVAIVQAIQQTPEFQWVREQMGQGAQPDQQMPQQPQQPMPQPQQPMPQQPQPMPQQPQPPSQEPMGGPSMAQPNQQQQQRYSSSNDPNQLIEQYNVLVEENESWREQYAQLFENNRTLVAEMAMQRQAVAALESRVVDGDRTQRLTDLYQAYPHFIVLEDEKETCLYSHGSDMSAEAFELHCQNLEKYAKRSSPVSRMVPGGAIPQDHYSGSDDIGKLTVDHYTALADKGIFKSFEECEAEVRAKIGATRV